MSTFWYSIQFLMIFFLSACFTNIYVFSSNHKLKSEAFFFKNGKEDTEWKNLSQKKEQEFPKAVLVELNEFLLERVKMFWGKKNTTSLPIKKTILATFDPFGLQEYSEHTNTQEFLQAVEDLKTLNVMMLNECPTMHVLNELVQNNLSDCSILLMTGSKPLDKDFSSIVTETLIRKKCQLSVLWFSDKNPEKYTQLKELALKSGGKFGFFAQEVNNENKIVELNFPRKQISPEVLNSVKFPVGNDNAEKVSAASLIPLSKQKTAVNSFIPIIVEVASGASLENKQGNEIPFTVKNTLNIPLSVIFGAKLNEVPQIIQPQKATLKPMQTETIKVYLQPNSITQPSVSSILTFTVFGPTKQFSRSAIISPLHLIKNDRKEPFIKHKYDGDCSQFTEPQTCENNQWSLEITLHDEDSGLLKVVSEPPGLLFQTEFLAGVKQQITTYYIASCCHPKVDIWAEDLKGNKVKKSYDILNQENLLAGEIAAIVVGVILLVFLITSIIVGVILYKRRNRRNLVIPRTIGGSK